MHYCNETRAMLRAYQRETDAQIFALQRKIYELQSRVFHLEMERYFEAHKFEHLVTANRHEEHSR